MSEVTRNALIDASNRTLAGRSKVRRDGYPLSNRACLE